MLTFNIRDLCHISKMYMEYFKNSNHLVHYSIMKTSYHIHNPAITLSEMSIRSNGSEITIGILVLSYL